MATFVHLLRPEDVPSTRQKYGMLKRSACQNLQVPFRVSDPTKLEPRDLDPVDMYFSSVPKPPKKKRKIGIPPAPPPDSRSHFHLHTPPSTPRAPRRKLTTLSPLKASTQTLLPCGRLSTSTAQKEFGPFVEGTLDGAPLPHTQPLPATIPLRPLSPPIDHHIDTTPGGYDDIIYENREEPSEPDQAIIKEKVDRYYPLLVGQYAPATHLDLQCATPQCAQSRDAYYSCLDCLRMRWYCRQCIVSRHHDHALHRIEKWDLTQGCKVATSLGDLGFVLELDHPNGHSCDCTSLDRPMETLTVLHINGLHRVPYQVCYLRRGEAGRRTATPEQLLINRLFPATNSNPEQAYTFDLLNHYDILDLYGHVNIKQFCDGMLAMGYDRKDASGRLRKHFHLAIRYWRLFRVMMNMGVPDYDAFLLSNAMGTCPACPQPGVNLPHNWEEHEYRDLLFAVFLSGDGNFHIQLMQKAKSLLVDPSLFGDSGAWVPYKVCRDYVRAAQNPRAVTRASDTDAACGSQAGTAFRDRPTTNLSISGAFGIQCKHGLWRPNGFAKFPKGERFDIVDVPFLIQLQREFSSGIKQVVWMYDVNCKYSVNCYSRSFTNPYSPLEPLYQDYLKSKVTYLVNTWHGNAHKPECADKHSLRNTPNTGMVTGEEVETSWPAPNGKQYDAREMDEGGHQDEYTAIFIQHNHQKLDCMGSRLESHYLHSAAELERHEVDFKDLEDVMNEINPAAVPFYRQQYQESGGEQFRPNSAKFGYPTKAKELHKLRMEEKETAATLARAAGVTLADLANEGLNWEQDWSHLRNQTNKGTTSYQKREFQLVQQRERYTGQVEALFPTITGTNPPEAQAALPSSYTAEITGAPEHREWAKVELRLRVGYGHELIDELRRAVGLHSWLMAGKGKARGVKSMAKVSGSLKAAARKRNDIISDYIHNWSRISKLKDAGVLRADGFNSALQGLQKLDRQTDIKFFEEWGNRTGNYVPASGNGASWIWQVAMSGQIRQVNEDAPLSDIERMTKSWESEARRLAWVHAFARTERWKEEVLLVREEIRRVGAWYRFHLESAQQAVHERRRLAGTSRFARGFTALLIANHLSLNERYGNLSDRFKDHEEVINADQVALAFHS